MPSPVRLLNIDISGLMGFNMIRTDSGKRRLFATLVGLSALLMLAVACGSDNGGSDGVGSGGDGSARQVVDNGRTYTIEDIQATGAKTPKEYDVSDLPGATGAWNALLERKEYEVRFYGSHADAVEMGTSWAESVTGEDAQVVGDDVQWEEGAKDRRQCNRSVAHSGCNYTARYGDFVILGNMILMCEGPNSEEALKVCDVMIERFS